MDRPAAPSPSGYVVDMRNTQTSSLELGLWVGVAGMATSTLFLILRIIAKTLFAKVVGLDDLFILLSWALAMAVQSLIIYLRLTRSIGVHMWDMTVAEANDALLMIEVTSILYLPLMAFAKISLCLCYRKFSNSRLFQSSIWITIAIISAYSIAIILILVLACNPLEKSWDITVKRGACIDKGLLYLSTAAGNAASDLVLLLLPIPIVIQLNTTIIQKVGLAFMFAIGWLTLITSCIRLAVFLPTIHNSDLTWAISTPAIWTSIEISLIIVCGCLPTLPSFFKGAAPHHIGGSLASRRTQSPELASEPGYKSRLRPISALTLFNGKQNRAQHWERMPEMPPAFASPSPATKVSLEAFDFELPKQGTVTAHSTEITHEKDRGDSLRTQIYDWQ